VLDGAGRPLDSLGEIKCEERVPLMGKLLNPLQRRAIREPLDVGVRSINALLCVGRGQRVGLFAGSGVGKSVLLGMMARYTEADVIVVGLIGERGREVKEFIEKILGEQGRARSVVVAAPASAMDRATAGLPEAVTFALPETAEGTIVEAALGDALARAADGVDAVAIGPGLSTHPATQAFVRAFVQRSSVPMVLDADGLTAFADAPGALTQREREVVLTPHRGEAARLGVGEGDALWAARELVATSDAVALIKGTRSVIAEPGGHARINPTGTPVLATAGTGDVLTGTIAGLLARGLVPFDAAWAGAYVHGLAGVLAGRDLGEGAGASDVADRLPEALATTSLGLANALGRADGTGAVSRAEVLANCRAIADATDLPVNADLENCYAHEPEAAAGMIRLAAESGVVGGSIEDATGDPQQPIYEFDLAVERVRAAARVAHSLPTPFMLTARAENFLHGRRDMDDTVRRLRAFEAAGADVLYAPGLRDLASIRIVAAAVGRPIIACAFPRANSAMSRKRSSVTAAT